MSLERLDYRLWAGEVSVEGVAVRGPRLEITCARAGVDVGLGTGVRVQVDAPRVVVTQGPETGDEPPSQASQPWTILERFEPSSRGRGVGELELAGAPRKTAIDVGARLRQMW